MSLDVLVHNITVFIGQASQLSCHKEDFSCGSTFTVNACVLTHYCVLLLGTLLSHLLNVPSMVECQLVLLTVRRAVAKHMYVVLF